MGNEKNSSSKVWGMSAEFAINTAKLCICLSVCGLHVILSQLCFCCSETGGFNTLIALTTS